jgi:5-methylthioadenosine/S-adenosylhomocysteine deaminase
VTRDVRTLVHGRSLLTGRLDQPEIPEGGLVIDGVVIADVGKAAELRRAAAARFGELTGVLAPGMRADVVLLDATRLEEPAVPGDVPIPDLLIARGLGSDVRTVLIDGEIVLDEGTHTWIDRDALVAELRLVARSQASDPRRREMSITAERLARAYDAYPTQVFDPLSR